ncbi:MAG: phosphoesterase [Ponticaulis sp.]|nr:phosphoesterase [Ponticaulis sp.]
MDFQSIKQKSTEAFHLVRNRLPFGSGPLIGFGVMAAAFFAFWSIAEEILEGEGHSLDEDILLALREPGDPSQPIGPFWLEYSMTDITSLGGYTVLTLLLTASAVYLISMKRWRHAAIAVGAVLSGTLLSSLLKLGFSRPRPELVEHLTHAMSSSFPSGHATLSAIAYLTLGMIVAEAHERRRVKALIITGAVVTTLLVGMSRVFLGVHWPSDVLAGWALGTGWAMLWWLVLHMIKTRPPIS